MRIHHLNCGCHCPLGGALFDGRGGRLLAELCTHCLLIETSEGLVLVDTGYGTHDMLGSRPRRLPCLWSAILNIRYRVEDTAAGQIQSLGYSARDVRHIVLTHMDFDHAGGIVDFPRARIHVLADEYRSANGELRGLVQHQRYRPVMWARANSWHTYVPDSGERWFGFEAVRMLEGLPPEILMIPLGGHTAGHAGVAVDTGKGWLLHAGDAFLHGGQLAEPARMPWGLSVYERIMAAEPAAGRANLERLRRLAADNAGHVRIFCSHDTDAFLALSRANAA